MKNEKRLIDANELCLGKFPRAGMSDYKNGWNDALDAATTQAPPVDAVEVVRCKDCAVPHNKWTGCPKLSGLVPPPDFYCAYGERNRND